MVAIEHGTWAGVERLIERARALTDHDRVALADARAAVDETFHVGAWRAANEILVERAQDYLAARVRIGSAFIPERLEELVERGSAGDPEVERWQRVARLAQAAVDDALLALLGADTMRPPDLRELLGPWQAMQAAAHERADRASAG